MHSRLEAPPRRLNEFEREVILNAAAAEVAREIEAPFRLRAGLLVEMLALYDDLRRRGSSVDTFERLLTRELERDADIDRGAERLLRQTRFLAAAFREYEARRDALGAVDEYALRTRLLDASPARPIRKVIVTVGERSVDPAGLWPADLDLLTRLPLLEHIDIVATRATIAAGLLDRLEKFMPGFEEGELETILRMMRIARIARFSLPRRTRAVHGQPRSRGRAVSHRGHDQTVGALRPRAASGGLQTAASIRLSRARRFCRRRRSLSDVRRDASRG